MGRTEEGYNEKTQLLHSNNNTQHTTLLNNSETYLLAVNPATAYHVVGSVGNKAVRFMLDTGAAISLISDRTWNLINGGQTNCPKNISAVKKGEAKKVQVAERLKDVKSL